MPEKIFLLNSLTEVFKPSDINKEKLEVPPKSLWSNSSLFSQDLLIITQNKQVKEWLIRQSAQSFGLTPFDPTQSQLLDQAVRQLLTQFAGFDERFALTKQQDRQQLLFSADLRLVVYKYLEERVRLKDADFQNVANYINDEKTKSTSISTQKLQSSRLFALAASTAQLIEEYSMRYDDLIATWKSNQLYLKENLNEKWQQRLWFDLFGKQESAAGGAVSPFALVSDVIRYILEHNLPYQGALKRIIIIGTPFLNALTHRFFMHLGKFVELNIFAYGAIDLQAASLHQNNFNKQYAGAFLEYHDYLHQQGYGYQSLAQQPKSGALAKLQGHLFNSSSSPFDDSNLEGIKLVACSDPLREVEALKDLLLKQLSDDKALRLQDICIVMSDPQLYTPHIKNVFNMPLQNHKIPVYFDEVLAGVTVSAMDQAILSLLNLSGTRFKQSQIFSILNNAAIIERLELTEQEKGIWLEFCQQHHVAWGFVAEQRQAEVAGATTESASDAFTWLRAFIYYLNEYVDGYLDPLGDEIEFSSSEADVIGIFIHFVHQLYDTFHGLAGERYSLEQWIEHLEPAIAKFLPGVEAKQGRVRIFRSISEIAKTLDNLNYELLGDNSVPFAVVVQLIEESLEREFEGVVENGAQQGILCAPLSAVRILPFKIVAFLGMGQSQYPTSSDRARGGYDLTQLLEESGNSAFASTFIMKASNNERASFFETCMAAGDQLWFFYQAVERLTGEKLEPSLVIYDLLQQLNAPMVGATPWYQADASTFHISYPLHPFDFSLFYNKERPSYYPHAYRYAQAFYGRPNTQDAAPDDFELNTFNQVIDIKLDELVDFIWNPLDTSLSAAAGIKKQWFGEDEGDFEDFALSSSTLQHMHKRLVKWHFEDLESLELISTLWKDAIKRDELVQLPYVEQAYEQFSLLASTALEALSQSVDCVMAKSAKSYSFQLALDKAGNRVNHREQASYIIRVEVSGLYRLIDQSSAKVAYIVLPHRLRMSEDDGLHSYDYKHRIKGRLLNLIFKQMGWQDRVITYLGEYTKLKKDKIHSCKVHAYEDLESMLKSQILLETVKLYKESLSRPLLATSQLWVKLRGKNAKSAADSSIFTKNNYLNEMKKILVDEAKANELALLGFDINTLKNEELQTYHFERLEQLWRYFMVE